MWTAITTIRDDGAVETTATFTVSQTNQTFSYGATIKQDQGSIDTFVQEAHKYLTIFQTSMSANTDFQTQLTAALNK